MVNGKTVRKETVSSGNTALDSQIFTRTEMTREVEVGREGAEDVGGGSSTLSLSAVQHFDTPNQKYLFYWNHVFLLKKREKLVFQRIHVFHCILFCKKVVCFVFKSSLGVSRPHLLEL